jgi:hypothetical protein
MFSHTPPSFYFFPGHLFEALHEQTCLLSPSFAALIHVSKVDFFISGSKINFQEKIKNMEWQRENMTISSIVKTFDPMK